MGFPFYRRHMSLYVREGMTFDQLVLTFALWLWTIAANLKNIWNEDFYCHAFRVVPLFKSAPFTRQKIFGTARMKKSTRNKIIGSARIDLVV